MNSQTLDLVHHRVQHNVLLGVGVVAYLDGDRVGPKVNEFSTSSIAVPLTSCELRKLVLNIVLSDQTDANNASVSLIMSVTLARPSEVLL